MLVDAYEQCGDALQGDASVCSILSASISSATAGSCQAEGQVVAEVSLASPRLASSQRLEVPAGGCGALLNGMQY
jgi:hypothetical protein